MVTGLSLENLAKVIHADKQRMYAEERFVRQVEIAQRQTLGESVSRFSWRERIKWIATHHLVVRLAAHPLRLTIRWI